MTLTQEMIHHYKYAKYRHVVFIMFEVCFHFWRAKGNVYKFAEFYYTMFP
jgi:hypothetical protein